jgi:hypothetical protein
MVELVKTIGEQIFGQMLQTFKWYRTIRQFVKAGNHDFVYVIIKREAQAKDVQRVLKVMQKIALAEYGETCYAFETTIWAGKKGRSVLLFVPPHKYSEVKREQGSIGSIDNLIRKMTVVETKNGRGYK